jgi:hypothetical protein
MSFPKVPGFHREEFGQYLYLLVKSEADAETLLTYYQKPDASLCKPRLYAVIPPYRIDCSVDPFLLAAKLTPDSC